MEFVLSQFELKVNLLNLSSEVVRMQIVSGSEKITESFHHFACKGHEARLQGTGTT